MSRKLKNMPGYEYDHRKRRWVKSSLGILGLETLSESDYNKNIATNFMSNMHLANLSMKENRNLVVSEKTPGVTIDDGVVTIVDREAYLKHMLGLEESFDLPQEVIDNADSWGDEVNGSAYKKSGDNTFMLKNSNMDKIAIFTIESVYDMDEVSFQGEVQKLGDRFVDEAKDDMVEKYTKLLRLRDVSVGYAVEPSTIKDIATGEQYEGYCVGDHYLFNEVMSEVCGEINAQYKDIAFYYKNGEIVPNIKHLKNAIVKRAEKFSQ